MYRPRYCRECGQRIERERWRSWHSTGFCDRCAPRFHLDWLGRTSALITIGAVIGFGLGSWDAARQTAPAPPLQIEPQTTTVLADLGSALAQGQEKESSANSGSRRNPPPDRPESTPDQSSAKSTTRSKSRAEQVSICGAPTKSGKPCRRRVKGGGRCWQHRNK